MTARHFHAVRFYESEPALCRIVANFLREGLVLDQPGILIATPEHAQGVLAELRAREMDVKALQASGDLIVLNAYHTMRRFIVGGAPHAEKFKGVMAEVLAGVRRGRPNALVRAYGEMVNLLWGAGRDVAAIQLERLWNRLARTNDLSLLCGYALGNFYKDASVQDVCRQHTHLISSDGTARPSNADSLLIGALKP